MKKKDFILLGAVLLVAILIFAVFSFVREDGAYVVVRVDGQERAKYSLREDGEYSIADGKNVLCIENGKAYMKSADCPDKLCVKIGKISKNGESITCLPHRVTVTVYGGAGEAELNVN